MESEDRAYSEEEKEDGRSSYRQGAIGLRTAIFLFAILVITACLVLNGKPLLLALIIIGGLAAKSYLHWLREKIRD